MLVCTKHPRSYVERHCDLQQRASDAWAKVQASGDSSLIILRDRDDPTHVAIIAIGYSNDADEPVLPELLALYGLNPKGAPLCR